MSSSRAHVVARLTGQQHETTKQRTPVHGSRIPTKPTTAESSEQPRGTQHVARMMKRSSRSTPTSENDSKGSIKAPTSVTSNSSVQSRRISATPSTFAPPIIRTPSLVSGSSISTFDSPRSTGLRRKPSGAIDRYAAQRRERSGTTEQERMGVHSLTGLYREDPGNTVLGISIPTTSKSDERQASLDMAGYNYASDALRDLTPPVLHYASSATPSTRYSDSPFSLVPTPSSASSYSPNLAATSHPSRSPVTTRSHFTGPPLQDARSRRGLAPVREDNPPSVPASTGRSTFRNRLTKARPNVSSERQKVQMPPELAHLNVEVPKVHRDAPSSRAPVRPSRIGTSNIAEMVHHSSVVHSDLPPVYTTYHKRTPSQETPTSASSPTKPRFGFPSRASSRTMSPRVDSAISPSTSARQFHRSQTPEVSSSGEGARLRRKDSPAVSQSPAKSPRFGFLSRKPKPDLPKPVEKPARRMSKGPVAGSGHEGYGKFSFRGRSGSNASSNGLRSPSADSMSSGVVRPAAGKRKSSTGSKSEPELDDFLTQRLRPVILRGSGSTMSTETVGASLEPASSNASSLDGSSQSRLLPSAMRKVSDASMDSRPSARWNASESSDDDVVRRRPNLATRRSITRLSSGEDRSPVRVPPPINTSLRRQPPDIDSYDAEPTAWPRTDSSLPLSEDGKEGLWLKPLDVKPSPKPARKWNFLHRAATSSPTKVQRRVVEPVNDERLPQNRALAHYAIIDETNALEIDEVERIVRESTDFEEDSFSDSEHPAKVVPHEGRHLIRMPSPPTGECGRDAEISARPCPPRLKTDRQEPSEPSEVVPAQPAYPHHAVSAVQTLHSPTRQQSRPLAARAVHTPDMTGWHTPQPAHDYLTTPELSNTSPRQPRLSPIGRIPAVISRRDRDRKLPDTSFSRPFASQNRPFAKPPGSVYSQIREMASPIESSSQPVSSTSTRSDNTIGDPQGNAQTNPSISTDRTSVDMHMQPEFLTFPPRKNSDQSYSNSDSSSIPSWMTTLPPQKEDVWNEYNDFMDEVMPLKTPVRTPTTGSSLGAPFQYSSMLWDGSGTSWPIPTRTGLPPTQQLPPIPGVDTVTTVLTVPQQIKRFLRPSSSPITPDTVSGLGCHIGNFPPREASLHHARHMHTQRSKRSSLASARASVSSGSRHSSGSVHSRSASVPNTRYSSPQMSQEQPLGGIAEFPTARKSVKSSPNLRLGALMTSKWLSFERVLFSPAHNEVQLADEPRVLIVDGLNSDWSHFVATAYPSAEVYNLTVSPNDSPLSTPPSNHRQIPLTSISASFPFPKGFFNSVVFRFPTATTEIAYTACLSECKRVLRPGGFLELAILDLDLMNMGPKARKAVRGLKTRMQQRDQEVCLGNLSDLLVRLIGRRGFENVQRCIVGVPTVGNVPQSHTMRSTSFSSASSSSGGSYDMGRHLRLADRLHTADVATRGQDESIAKMVARVGRWWYSSCYERALLPMGDSSIWKDRTLLRECERQGTSFRMLVCHAQKPAQVRRRTRSV